MFSKVILAFWSCAGLAWWMIALYLVAEEQRKKAVTPELTARRTLSIFKPLPPLGATGLQSVSGWT